MSCNYYLLWYIPYSHYSENSYWGEQTMQYTRLILFLIMYVLGRGGLVIFKTQNKSLTQTVGLYLITFAMFITIDWTSGYIQYVCTGNFTGVSSVYMQSEDGVTWYLWSLIIPTTSALAVEAVHILTYVVTPICLCLLGGYLARRRVEL